ncbi:hypothetical protein SAMN05443287_10494 [Micromonospora phaseoli]|uniref:Uncharacterized protein n=1 Tax=Micromonospora phaseoli TaxID=1144548 RepID=A0A1H6Y7E3_9ACTN|nr:hypothetical protein [Micromonospora phaseoli]PZW00067.1 hypothetical protein CLV64_10393 [Micromonospora phaseoli]GIJ79577.1 hypothetical protein Xph01_40090 [Micromonospora phaseoli]SEJ37218.1 hypothetical protein SAMN05443287_10494 [Micromonospora phaseoli]
MGIFGRKRKAPPAPPPGPPPPPTVAPGDLEVARRVVRAFLSALGDDELMQQAAQAVAQAGGGVPDLETLLRNARQAHQTGDLGIDRPWRWLTAVTAEAQRLGDPQLVAEIGYFVLVWDAQLRGRISSGELGSMLQLPPHDAVRDVYSTALFALAEVDPEQLITDRTGTVTVASLRTALANAVLDADPSYPVEVSTQARRLLDG